MAGFFSLVDLKNVRGLKRDREETDEEETRKRGADLLTKIITSESQYVTEEAQKELQSLAEEVSEKREAAETKVEKATEEKATGGERAVEECSEQCVEKERERLDSPALMNSEWRSIVHACTRREDMPASSTVLATRLSEACRLYCSARNLDAVVDTVLGALENCADEESVTFREGREKLLPLYFAAVPRYDHLDTLADAFKQ